MDKNSRIKELVQKVAGTDRSVFPFRLMEVVEVIGDTCIAKLGTMMIPDIRLSSIVGGAENGILITPAVGSIILVADISLGQLRELVVVAYSEVESVRMHKEQTTITAKGKGVEIEVGESRVEITDKLIQFNEGANAGLANVPGLIERLNLLELDINALKAAVAGWTPANPTEPDAASLKTAVGTWAGKTLEPTVVKDIEDDKITH